MVAAANGSAPAVCCANIVQIAAAPHQHQHLGPAAPLQRRPQCCSAADRAHLASRDCRPRSWVFADLAPGILQSQAAAAQSIRLLVLKFWLSGRQEARTRQETARLCRSIMCWARAAAAAAACCRLLLTAAAQTGYLPPHYLSLLIRTTNRTWLGRNVMSVDIYKSIYIDTFNSKYLPSCKFADTWGAEMETLIPCPVQVSILPGAKCANVAPV